MQICDKCIGDKPVRTLLFTFSRLQFSSQQETSVCDTDFHKWPLCGANLGIHAAVLFHGIDVSAFTKLKDLFEHFTNCMSSFACRAYLVFRTISISIPERLRLINYFTELKYIFFSVEAALSVNIFFKDTLLLFVLPLTSKRLIFMCTLSFIFG